MYKQLVEEQRVVIATLRKKGFRVSDIAEEVGVDSSSIYRELERNSSAGAYRVYNAKAAQQRASARASNKGREKVVDSEMADYIKQCLDLDWSPEQMVGRGDEEGIQIASHETIYQHIYEDKRNGGELFKKLRRVHRKRRKRKNTRKNRGGIIGRVGIEKRPPAVDRQDQFGHWEGDTIVGKGHKSAMATMIERKSLYIRIIPLDHKGAAHTAKRIVEDMQGLLCRTITLDNGTEFSHHTEIAQGLNAKVFFANPYSAWERGCNENGNGLIRQYLPKSTALNETSHKEAKAYQEKLNNRPRKKLGFRTPNEVFLRYCRT